MEDLEYRVSQKKGGFRFTVYLEALNGLKSNSGRKIQLKKYVLNSQFVKTKFYATMSQYFNLIKTKSFAILSAN